MDFIYCGNSMRGTFRDGDKLLAEKVPFDDIGAGDVILYFPDGEKKDALVHRVIRKEGGALVTMGDNNPREDVRRVTEKDAPLLVVSFVRSGGKIFCSPRGAKGMVRFRLNRVRHYFFRTVNFWKTTAPKEASPDRISEERKTLLDSISVLGDVFYNGGTAAFDALSSKEKKLVCRMSEEENFDAFLFLHLRDRLPQDTAEKFRKNYMTYSLNAMRSEALLKKFRSEAGAENIRYALIKGADFAYRVYPNPALRRFSDWDIVFHPDDYDKALDFLARTSWKVISEGGIEKECHHGDPVVRDGVMLEPHKNLPCADEGAAEKIWEWMEPCGGEENHEYRLSPELNLVMLCGHLAEDGFLRSSLQKFLLDAAYLIRHAGKIDFAKAEEMAGLCAVPSPSAVLNAWKEFFPSEILSSTIGNEEESATIRKIFLERYSVFPYSHGEIVMNQSASLSPGWFLARLSALRPSRVRNSSVLADGGRGEKKSFFAYFKEVLRRGLAFFRAVLRPNKNIRSFTLLTEKYSASLRDRREGKKS